MDSVEFGRLVSAAREATGKRAADLLLDALELWRGNAYEDVSEHFPIADEARRLDEERVQAESQYAELKLQLGQHAELVPRLARLIRAHPFNEDFRRHQMLALYRCGRQADALEIYRNTRQLLDEELGVEPGPRLQRLHEALLRSDPALDAVEAPKTTVPRELPSGISSFVGRAEHMQLLNQMLTSFSPVVITAIGGSAGVGKTALAVHWGHSVTKHFPDGQLYINLRGFDAQGSPLSPAGAIRRLLESLGVAPEHIPSGVDAQAALYRSQLSGKRVLVVLDNARDAEQVRLLLPGSSTAFTVITSRYTFSSLTVTVDARHILLDVLSAAEARQLLTARLGRERVAAECEAADEIISRCARLPLALAIAAARAAIEPTLSLAALARELGEARSRLDLFQTDDRSVDLRAVFSWSYNQLSSGAAQLFRLLSLHPGPDLSAAAASSLLGLQAGPLLGELTRAQLVDEHTPSRFGFHDLLRAYATEEAHAMESVENRNAAIRRMLDHYLHTAHNAAARLYTAREPVSLNAACDGVVLEVLSGHAEAMTWFTAEHRAIHSLVMTAHMEGHKAHTWQLVWATALFLDRQGYWTDWIDALELALAAAEDSQDGDGQAKAHQLLGCTKFRIGHLEDACRHFQKVLELHERRGNRLGQANAHQNLALTYTELGDLEKALDHSRCALSLHRIVGDRTSQARSLNSIGWKYNLLGDHKMALEYCEDALAQCQELGQPLIEANAWDSIGRAHHYLGDFQRAITCYLHALRLHRELDDRYYEAETLLNLGDTYQAVGQFEGASTTWRDASRMVGGRDHPIALKATERLAALPSRSDTLGDEDNLVNCVES